MTRRGVVQEAGLAFAVLPHLVADADLAAVRDDERQVGGQPRVGRAAMREQVRACQFIRELTPIHP